MTVRQWRKKLKDQVKKASRRINFFEVRVFDEAPDILRATQEDEGKKLWLADEYRTKTIRLKEYNEGELEITYAGEKKYRVVYEQEALLHPEEIDEERLNKFGYEVSDGRKTT